MEFNGLLILAAVWFLLNLLTSGRRKPAPPARPKSRSRPEPRIVYPGADPTQQEGTRLEQVLRNLQRTLEEAAETDQRPYRALLPPTEEVEERASLEVAPEVVSLEGEVRREARRRVDQDDEAGEIEVRRVQAAADRDAPRVRGDHVAFDQRIRQEPAEHTASPGYTAQQLRDAIVWREILGPPVGLRDGE